MSERLAPPPLLVEGPSKGMKSSAAKAIAAPLLARGMQIMVSDAGSFFRKTTVGTLEAVQLPLDQVTDADLHAAARDVLAAGVPYETERDWPDLHTALIDSFVGRISTADHVQRASEDWWNRTYEYARENGFDAVVLDGRNPRERLRAKMDLYGIGPVMELFCECDPRVAAQRTLRGRGNLNFTPEELRAEEESIVGRRLRDANRPASAYPYRPPEYWVGFEPGMDPFEVVGLAYMVSKNHEPLPIRMDMTTVGYEPMNRSIAALTIAAWDMAINRIRA